MAAEARERITGVIEFADQDLLDVAGSRAAEQDVLDLLNEPPPGEIWLADLGLAAKTRPVVIVSRRTCNDGPCRPYISARSTHWRSCPR